VGDAAERPDRAGHDFWWGILLIARILAVGVVVVLAPFGVAELIRGGPSALVARDAFRIALFPFGFCVGYLIACRRGFLGALISLGCLAVLYGVWTLIGERPPVIPMLYPFGIPALLFVYHWAFAPDAKRGR
jgi:hypothetical protein